MDIGELEMRKLGAYRRGIDFDERDVEILVDVNHFAIELLASRQEGEKRLLAPSHVGIGGDHASAGYKKP